MPDLGMRFWGAIRGQQAPEKQPAAAASAGGQKTSWWQKFVGFFQTSRPPVAQSSLGQSQRSGGAQHIEQRGNPAALAGLQAKAPLPKDLSVEQAKELLVASVINSVDSNEAGISKLFEAATNPQARLDHEFEQKIAHKDVAGGELHIYPEALRNSEVEKAHLQALLQAEAVKRLGEIASNTSINGNVRTKALETLGKIFRYCEFLEKDVRMAALGSLVSCAEKLSLEREIGHMATHQICIALLDPIFKQRGRDIIFAELEGLHSKGIYIHLNPAPDSEQSYIVNILLQRARQNEQTEEREIARDNLKRLYPLCPEVSQVLRTIARHNTYGGVGSTTNWIREITNP